MRDHAASERPVGQEPSLGQVNAALYQVISSIISDMLNIDFLSHSEDHSSGIDWTMGAVASGS